MSLYAIFSDSAEKTENYKVFETEKFEEVFNLEHPKYENKNFEGENYIFISVDYNLAYFLPQSCLDESLLLNDVLFLLITKNLAVCNNT